MNTDYSIPDTTRALLARGVVMPSPEAVWVDDSVMPERIARGVVLHPATRLTGDATSIGPDSVVGKEGPAVLDSCQLGHGVSFKGGYACGGVFLDGAEMGLGAHVRSGTVLEEQAGGAHTVGFKQTILLAYVTTGSLINFCDCLMAGGTSRKNHSEVGSSYIHFNFTPHSDKATPSLIGDVPRGVLLDQPPIFLGGQGGLVGPARIAYGVVIAAGTIQRKDALEAGCLYAGPTRSGARAPKPYPLGQYGAVNRLVRNNLIYFGNIQALQVWYRHVRVRFMRPDPFREACRLGAIQQMDTILKERLKRLQDLADKMPASIAALKSGADAQQAEPLIRQQERFAAQWPAVRDALKHPLKEPVGEGPRTRFLAEWEKTGADTHIEAVRALSPDAKAAATAWMQAIVDRSAGLFDANMADA